MSYYDHYCYNNEVCNIIVQSIIRCPHAPLKILNRSTSYDSTNTGASKVKRLPQPGTIALVGTVATHVLSFIPIFIT